MVMASVMVNMSVMAMAMVRWDLHVAMRARHHVGLGPGRSRCYGLAERL